MAPADTRSDMTALTLALALATATPAPPVPVPSWYGGRVLITPTLHIGARPAIFVDNEGTRGRLEVGAGATIQISTF
jgi:hypothetical protein